MCIARKENSSQNIQQHISSKEGSISVIKGTWMNHDKSLNKLSLKGNWILHSC